MIAFHCVFDEEGSKLTNHAGVSRLRVDGVPLQVNAKHLTTAFDYLGSQFSEQFCGPISETLASELAKWDRTNVAAMRMPLHEGGFTRINVR